MKVFQVLNLSAMALIMSATVFGVGRFIYDNIEDYNGLSILYDNYSLFAFASFIVLFRLKTCIDDHSHFGEEYSGPHGYRLFGFVLAIISWILWGFAGFLASSPTHAAEFLAFSILVSTAWIAVHLREITRDHKRRNIEIFTSLLREKWIVINVLLIILLSGYAGYLAPVMLEMNDYTLIGLFLVLVFDWVTSRQTEEPVK